MLCPNCQKEYEDNIEYCSDCIIPLVEEIDDKEYVAVLRTGSKPEVAVFKSILEDAGIPYGVKGEGIQDLIGVGSLGGGINFVLGPMEVAVNKAYLEEVINLLKAMQSDIVEESEE